MLMSADESIFSLQINKDYVNAEFSNEVKACLRGEHENSLPFPHFSIDQFVHSKNGFLGNLRNDLSRLEWTEKSTDLYDISQTIDLKFVDGKEPFPAIYAFRHFLETKVCNWLRDATNVKLNGKVSLNGSKYCYGNALLPHDDRLEGRAFAFVYYLTPGWKKEFGGRLHLYGTESSDTDDSVDYDNDVANHNDEQSSKFNNGIEKHRSPAFLPVKSIIPAENAFIFFRVQHNSWHAVEEVLDTHHERLSINGWFYADGVMPRIGKFKSSREYYEPDMRFSTTEKIYWINQKYLHPLFISSIGKAFTSASEILLPQFLRPDKYDMLLKELALAEANFLRVGAIERKNYFQINEDTLSKESLIYRFLCFLRSESFFDHLSQLTNIGMCRACTTTDLDSSPVEKKRRSELEEEASTSSQLCPDESSVIFESSLSRFSHGCYTTTDDYAAEKVAQENYSVEIFIFLSPELLEWPEELGGFTSFFDDSAEITRILPTANALAIVFRRPGIQRFTKYVNCRAGTKRFFVYNASSFCLEKSAENDDDDKNNDADVSNEK